MAMVSKNYAVQKSSLNLIESGDDLSDYNISDPYLDSTPPTLKKSKTKFTHKHKDLALLF